MKLCYNNNMVLAAQIEEYNDRDLQLQYNAAVCVLQIFFVKEEEKKMAKITEGYMPFKGYPVSYTHLDVYKRQLYWLFLSQQWLPGSWH